MAQPRQRRRRGYNQRELIAFLDAQERNVERIEPADDDIIAEFDSLNRSQISNNLFKSMIVSTEAFNKAGEQSGSTL